MLRSARTILLLIIGFASCKESHRKIESETQTQSPDCNKVWEGKFQYRANSPAPISIDRRTTFQIEKDEVMGMEDTFSVKWISPCEYELSAYGVADASVIHSKITKIALNYYVCESKTNSMNYPHVDTMLFIR